MRFYSKSVISILLGLTRFFICKAFYLGRLKTKGVSIISSRCEIIIKKNSILRFGRKTVLANNILLQSNGLLEIGNNTNINKYSRIVAHEKISIGSNVIIAQFVTILDHDHNFFLNNKKELVFDGYKTAPIKIGDNVWISDKCTIAKGVSIGDNSIIGANSFVNKDIPANCIAGGSPAVVLKKIA